MKHSKNTNPETVLQSLEAKITKLEALVNSNTWQKAALERDMIQRDLTECLVVLDMALSGAPDWREKAIHFLNTTPRNRSSV